MGKVWFMSGLVTCSYHTAIIETNLMVFCALRIIHLPEAVWILIPPLSREGKIFLSGKPAFHCLTGAVRQ